jgi:hypothetical protein
MYKDQLSNNWLVFARCFADNLAGYKVIKIELKMINVKSILKSYISIQRLINY